MAARPAGRHELRRLVLPPHRTISLPVLRKLEELARAGGVIIGQRPETSSGLRDWQTAGDREAKELIQRLWPADDFACDRRRLAETGRPASRFLRGVTNCKLDYIHRRDGETDIYFIANPERKPIRGAAAFRVAGKVAGMLGPRHRQHPHTSRMAHDGRRTN